MADTKISGLTEDTAPHRTNDFAPTYDASATATKKVSLKNFGVIPIVGGFASSTPADGTTYFFGLWHEQVLIGTGGYARLYMPRAGIITTAMMEINSTPGSAETSTISIRLNDTSDTTLCSTVALNASPFVFTTTSLTLSVAQFDYVELKWVTPTWATNPTTVFGRVTLILE